MEKLEVANAIEIRDLMSFKNFNCKHNGPGVLRPIKVVDRFENVNILCYFRIMLMELI